MTTLIHQRVAEAQRGENSKVICRMPSGWAVMGDRQVLSGYTLLLPDPVPPSLNNMPEEHRERFLHDMVILGDALLEVTGAARINYEILGNSDPALHAHVIPRYDNEPEERRRAPVWFYDFKTAREFSPDIDRPLMERLAKEINRRLEK
jgi:diadenosine tetraphosphate (Ap4A) HIT family hydrolase